jgi:hypothetical protein
MALHGREFLGFDFHDLGSVKVKESGERAADAQGEEHRAQVI